MSSLTNWKAIVERKNAETYKLPPGWDSREAVAEKLDCSPERVAEVLRPALKDGTVERKVFPVWDKDNKRVFQVTAYREVKKQDKAAAAAAPAQKKPSRRK
jgi:DNA-binding Lrp family transcriptional regulator